MTSTNTSEDLHHGRGWLNRAAEMLDGCEDHVSDAEFAHAAAIIGNGFIALAHAERAMRSSATLDAAAERVRRAADEARPHDNEIDDEVDQPDGIASDSHDLPDAARASERVNTFLAWWGDGRIGEDVLGAGPPLFARDLQALANAAVPRA